MRLLPLLLIMACTDLAPGRVDIAADSAAGEVPFELAGAGGAALVVSVHLNGTGPWQFIVDTGATVTCVDQAVAATLSLPELRGVVGTAASVSGQGGVRLVALDSLRMGGVTAHDLEACVIDLEHLGGMGLELDGLVGLNVLSEFRVTLDFERSIVRFEKP